LTIAFIERCIRWRRNKALAVQREGDDAAEAAEAIPQATPRPHIRVRVAEPLLPLIDRAETLPLYDLDVVGARLPQSSEAVTVKYYDYNNHRHILMDPVGNPLDGTSHEEEIGFSSPPFKPLQVLASSGASLDPQSVSVRTEQSEPPPAYPLPVYSIGSRRVG